MKVQTQVSIEAMRNIIRQNITRIRELARQTDGFYRIAERLPVSDEHLQNVQYMIKQQAEQQARLVQQLIKDTEEMFAMYKTLVSQL